MIKLKNKGFAGLEVLLIVVIAGIVGGTGWYVLRTKDKDNQNEQQATEVEPKKTQNDKEEKEKTASYIDSKEGYSFSYPTGWNLSVKEEKGYFDQKAEKLTTFNSITIKSPDYKGKSVSNISNGAAFVISATPFVGEETEPSGPNQRSVTVDGESAFQIDMSPAPHGEYYVETSLVKHGLNYDVFYMHSENGKAKYYSEYKALLASFKTNK